MHKDLTWKFIQGRLEKRTKQELSFLYATLLLDLIYVPTKYYQISQTVWELWHAQDFGLRGDKYITKVVNVDSLARDTSSSPYLCLYQILSTYFKPLRSYGVHKNLA